MKSKMRRLTGLIVVLVLIVALSGCSCSSTTVIDPEGDGSNLSKDYNINILVPETPGTTVYSGNGVTIDASNVKDGYVAVKCESKQNRLKAQVMLGDHSYNYDLASDNEYDIFPLQMGNGTYKVIIHLCIRQNLMSKWMILIGYLSIRVNMYGILMRLVQWLNPMKYVKA